MDLPCHFITSPSKHEKCKLQTFNFFRPSTIHTDDSAIDAVGREGGVYIKCPGGNEEKISLAVSLHSTNFKAEEAHAKHSTDTASIVIFFTDTLSVLETFMIAMTSLCRAY